MKVDQALVPSSYLLPEQKKTQESGSPASGQAEVTPDRSKVESESSVTNEKAFKYPAATPEEINAKNRRADKAVADSLTSEEATALSSGSDGRAGKVKIPVKTKAGTTKTGTTKTGTNKTGTTTSGTTTSGTTTSGKNPTVTTTKPKPKPKPTSAKPQTIKPVGSGNTASKPNSNINTINNLQDNINLPPPPPSPSSAAGTFKNALITSVTNNGVSSFFNVGAQITSDYFSKKEAAQAEMPGATVQNEDGTIGTVDPLATQEQIMDARLKGAKNSLEFATVMMSFLSEGKDGSAFEDVDDAPDATPEERMDNLEERMDIMEEHLPDLTKRYKFEYDPYVPADSSEPPTEEARMDNIERRYTYILKKLKAARAVMESNA